MKKRKTIKLHIELDVVQAKRQRILVSVGDDNAIKFTTLPDEAMLLTKQQIINNRKDVLPEYRLIHHTLVV